MTHVQKLIPVEQSNPWTVPMFPIVAFDKLDLHSANELLVRWGHKMGPLERGNSKSQTCHALFIHGQPVAIATASSLIRERVGGGLGHLVRGNTIELSRVCAAERWANRVVLRLWRETVFPGTGKQYAISYQDAAQHTGNLCRFDGWTRAGFSSSGTDSRSGRRGRRKWIWTWEGRGAA